MKKSTKVLRIIFLVIISFSFLAAGLAKLAGSAQETAMFSMVHLQSTLVIIGVLELLIAIGVWWKKTRTLAILFATAILGAAVAETISIGMAKEIIAPGKR